MRVLIVENSPAPLQRWNGEALSDRSVENARNSIKAVLEEKGCQVSCFQIAQIPLPFIDAIEREKPDVVFNLCETICGNSRLEAAVPFLLRWLKIPFTGNSPELLSILVDKILTKRLLRDMGIPTPRFLPVFEPDQLNCWNSWPAILKPSAEDASLGIDNQSVVSEKSGAIERFEILSRKFGTPVLLESFIDGREVNAGLVENDSRLLIGINEIDFSQVPPNKPKIITHDGKWAESSTDFISTPVKSPAKLPEKLDEKIRIISRQIFSQLGLSGYARIDFRIDLKGKPFVLEINPNPDLCEDAGLAKSFREMGLTYPQAIEGIVNRALSKRSPGFGNFVEFIKDFKFLESQSDDRGGSQTRIDSASAGGSRDPPGFLRIKK